MQFSENGLVGVLKRCCITAGDRIRALTARHPIKLLHPAANPHGSLTPADAPLIDAENLFRQPGPPQLTWYEGADSRCRHEIFGDIFFLAFGVSTVWTHGEFPAYDAEQTLFPASNTPDPEFSVVTTSLINVENFLGT
jgi:hypothetical protein